MSSFELTPNSTHTAKRNFNMLIANRKKWVAALGRRGAHYQTGSMVWRRDKIEMAMAPPAGHKRDVRER